MKKKAVETTLKKALKREIKVNEVLGMDDFVYYRNKLIYPVGMDENNNLVMGVFANRSHRIIPVEDCKIQNQKCQKVAKDIFEFLKKNKISGYNEERKEGLVRHIIVRIGLKTDEIMVTLVLTDFNLPKEEELKNYVTALNPEVKTIVKNLNNKNTNVILGKENKIIYGNGYIEDYLGNKKFKISPMSFYQVNPVQTEKLYSKAVEFAKLSGDETIFDLYCGIGTIGIFASDKAKFLYGMETVPEAINDAKQNAILNNIKTAEFFVGDVEKTLPEFIKSHNVKPDVVFVDPPRKGCDKTAIDTLLEISPKKIIYVSCNPATFARDLKLFEEKYTITRLAICDMFPRNKPRRKYCLLGIEVISMLKLL
jgi:23S rRNA (uracil1939-C5)-methyltransferase